MRLPNGAERRSLAAELEAYGQQQPERRAVIEQMLDLLRQPGDAFSRTHLDPGHFTASAFVVCPERRRLLLIRHPKLGRWLQPGGHIEPGDVSCLAAAQREVREETGVAQLVPLGMRGVPAGLPEGIFDVDVHSIPANPREGAHAHFDVRYAFEARTAQLTVSDEVKAARWVELEAVAALNDEESIARPVRALLGVRGVRAKISRLSTGPGPR
jgi:8-oxo-dGTP pyrophosphatase MutT (NUDIX family)